MNAVVEERLTEDVPQEETDLESVEQGVGDFEPVCVVDTVVVLDPDLQAVGETDVVRDADDDVERVKVTVVVELPVVDSETENEAVGEDDAVTEMPAEVADDLEGDGVYDDVTEFEGDSDVETHIVTVGDTDADLEGESDADGECVTETETDAEAETVVTLDDEWDGLGEPVDVLLCEPDTLGDGVTDEVVVCDNEFVRVVVTVTVLLRDTVGETVFVVLLVIERLIVREPVAETLVERDDVPDTVTERERETETVPEFVCVGQLEAEFESVPVVVKEGEELEHSETDALGVGEVDVGAEIDGETSDVCDAEEDSEPVRDADPETDDV